MTANRKIVIPFLIKVYMENEIAKIESITDSLENIQELYDNKMHTGVIKNYEVYTKVHGNYQFILSGVEEYGM